MKRLAARLDEYTPVSDAAPGRVLSDHTDRSGTTIHGTRSITFGSIFGGVGVAVAALAWMEKLDASPGVPIGLMLSMGGMFAIAGFSLVAHGIAGLRIEQRVRRLRATHTREPWVWDHPWDESGARDVSARRIGRAIWLTGFLAVFVVPFNWIGFFTPNSLPFAIAAVLMDCIALGCAWRMVYLIGQRAKHGVSMLRFRRFPFRPGSDIELHLARPTTLASVAAPEARLRCVQERYETRRTSDGDEQRIVAYEVWSATRKAEFVRGEYVWRFDVPEGLPGTALSERPPRYLELDLKIELPGVDYAGTFLVPVYEDGRRR